jgi:hypothetical protein
MAALTVERLRELLNYDSETGTFTRKVKARGGRYAWAGARVGYVRPDGYRAIRIDVTRYREHRLAWFYVHGVWPTELDHVNGVRSDNRLINLREATRSQNLANRPLLNNNTSGVRGVSFDSASGLWTASVSINGKRKNLGLFRSKDDAINKRMNAHRERFGEFAGY